MDHVDTDQVADAVDVSYLRPELRIPSRPPPPGTVFRDLDLSAQVAFTTPILTAILEERYFPVRDKGKKYFSATHAKRLALAQGALKRGEMTRTHQRGVIHLVAEWVKRLPNVDANVSFAFYLLQLLSVLILDISG